jgi:hypothetical protein
MPLKAGGGLPGPPLGVDMSRRGCSFEALPYGDVCSTTCGRDARGAVRPRAASLPAVHSAGLAPAATLEVDLGVKDQGRPEPGAWASAPLSSTIPQNQ